MSSTRKHLIAGTAGHIDHGKTALVRALTGVDTDRLKEEKERGITIDLGFASSALSNDITLSWIDVPGHERFIGNMLAGVAGIDFVVLVIAANEGVMPQTREHFEICRILGVRHGVVAITKADLVDEEGLELARADAIGLITGSFLEDADIVPVSSRTGTGIEALRLAIAALAERTGARSVTGTFRLPIDRAFVMKGFGTVVTGTVFNGRVERDAEVEILPGQMRARVRGIQVHGNAVDAANRGQRAALNLTGVETSEILRGHTLALPRTLSDSRVLDVEVKFLEEAPELPSFSPVHFHLGTRATTARIRFHDRVAQARGGGRYFARLALDEGVVAVPGDRFVLRRFSPVVTIGGGIVLDNCPPRIRRKEDGTARLRALAEGGAAEELRVFCAETRYGQALDALVQRLGGTKDELRALAAEAGLRLLGAGGEWLVTKEQLEQFAERAQSVVAAFHRDNPMLPGMPLDRLRALLGKGVPEGFVEWLFTQDTRFSAVRDTVRLTVHQPRFSVEESAASHAIETAFLSARLQVPAVAEVLASCGIDPTRGETLLRTLIREGKLVKISQELVFHKQMLGETVALLQKRRGERFSVPQFKEWTGVSRKYAIPLLEFFDRQRVTRRDGDLRTIL